ncbi:hypothetical protein HWD16_gp20 [Microbacterium phage Arete]|uniref:Uncharacterized protein n=1 Tax=Microbacterium phage Arete TaxID=2713257 RepID=A0A6G8R142_9CAUD|nr:hypothetical protein HWD16_gp20 [Microbacterium phage Arete]QIN93903.1 hypothetical protein SEA_ARETE_20 [Microbacterium phage Arete]
MSKGPDPNRDELLNMPTEEYQALLNSPTAAPIVRNPQMSSPSRSFSHQQDLINRMFNDQRAQQIPNPSATFSNEGQPRRKPWVNKYWRDLMARWNPRPVWTSLRKELDENNVMVDNGITYVLVPVSVAGTIAEFLEVLVQHGVPEESRTPLTSSELNSILHQVNGFMRSNRPPAPDVQHYMGLAPGEMPRRVTEGIITALSYLGMLPDAGE